MQEIEIIEELKKHLKDDNFEMFCNVYKQCENSLAQHHDELIIDSLETTQLPLSKKEYFRVKQYVHFLVEKNPTLQLVCLMLAQKEDTSRYMSCFNSLEQLLFLLAAKDANCTDMLKHLDVQEVPLVKLLFKSNFKKGIEWLQTYGCKNKKLFCITVITTFFEVLNTNFENNKKEYNKCINLLCSKGLDKELTRKIIKIHLEEIKQEKEKIALAIIANQSIKIKILKERQGFWSVDKTDTKKNQFYTPLHDQFFSLKNSSKKEELAQKIYNFISLSKSFPDPDKVNAIKINKI